MHVGYEKLATFDKFIDAVINCRNQRRQVSQPEHAVVTLCFEIVQNRARNKLRTRALKYSTHLDANFLCKSAGWFHVKARRTEKHLRNKRALGRAYNSASVSLPNLTL